MSPPGTMAARPPVAPSPRARWQAWWMRVRSPLAWAFFALVAWLIWRQARELDWPLVWRTLRGLSAGTLALAAALAVASHSVYACFDLIGRHLTRHGLPRWRTMAIGFTSYAFNLNLGSLIGGVGLRLRLYARQGLPAPVIAQVLGVSLLTNWLGYLALASGLLLAGHVRWPASWGLEAAGLRLAGGVGAVVVAGYLAACAVRSGRTWTWRGHALTLPAWPLAVGQLVLSSLNWMLMAGLVHTLLGGRVDYPAVLATLLAAAVAGAVTHVPAGLGVVEAVFVAVLGAQLPRGELVAALLAYRTLYYLVPLGLAAVLLGRLEAASPARSGDLEHADGDAVGVAGARADEEAVHHPGQRR